MDFKEHLQSILSSRVINSTTGGGAGSILCIEMDTKRSFFIYCAWRIEQNDIVLSTSEDNSEALIGRMAKSAKYLENKTITEIKVSKQYDLEIKFEDNFCLKIFCNISYSSTEDGNTYDTNWELFIPDQDLVFKVSNSYIIETSTYY